MDRTDLEVAKLDLRVVGGPEVEPHLRPDRRGEVEFEGDLTLGDGGRIDGEVIGAEVVDRKVLHGWVRGAVPRASAGAVASCVWKL